ncbi:UNVERIFIED_ORG: hypothetical protein C7429_110150 [Pantoea allii]|jgi:hypothetical protein|uniref:hypothetical protein n=1 Tax=Enterobacterales TaxID=91347 RepID=UPI0007E53425|nr:MULTISPECIES: hypothetical protein [Pantoea]MDQ0433510.1 hypothetical protein [Pantoea agglomerans]NBB57117.1 hypothetical protein [Pantoea vagans]QZX96512.1 hypothetical protein K6R05_04585 [Pantoea alfalfae]WHU88038.1 hypothetical protein A7P62_00420 [Pantoea agglomerans pv. gypsophilae]WNN35430.1 hypothetical protein RIN65_04595 [Pantoea agglomerans]
MDTQDLAPINRKMACVQFIAEVSLIANCKQSDMKLAMSIIAELAHSSCEKVPDDEIFYAAE